MEKKRLDLNGDMGEWVQQSMKDLDLQEAPFTSAVAHESRFTLLGYRDPGDRFLVATAKVYDFNSSHCRSAPAANPGSTHSG